MERRLLVVRLAAASPAARALCTSLRAEEPMNGSSEVRSENASPSPNSPNQSKTDKPQPLDTPVQEVASAGEKSEPRHAGAERIISGIDLLDYGAGGLLPHKVYVVKGGSGVGKSILGLQYLTRGLELHEPGVLITDQKPANVIAQAHAIGFPIEESVKRGQLAILNPSQRYFELVESPSDVMAIVEELGDYIKNIGARRLVIDLAHDPATNGRLMRLSKCRYADNDNLCAHYRILNGRGLINYRGEGEKVSDVTKTWEDNATATRSVLLLGAPPEIVSRVKEALGTDYDVKAEADFNHGVKCAKRQLPGLVLVPPPRNLGAIRAILDLARESTSSLAFLSPAANRQADKVLYLRAGADDFITQPFTPAELRARVDALIRPSA